MRYKITKIGLLNFWLYDEEEFDFSDGKLLLRGSNGSGKSVTMQSFIPLILDGNKTPARLDPFGSKDKKIEDYLLGGVDSVQKDDATGYLYMEVCEEEKQKYVTIGMGLHARRGRPTDFWGFALQDGRRIGKDMFLYHNKVDKVLLTKNELRAKLGPENILVETTKEYKKMVNQLLFGFPSLDSYDEFINVLLQLRSPKLSKEYKPTKLMDILSGVLQPLTDEDLRPLSEAIEEMDKTKEKIEKLESDVKQLSYLLKAYNNYNETVLYKKTERYLESLKENELIQKQEKELEDLIQKEEAYLLENEKTVQDLEVEKSSIGLKKANMDLSVLESKTEKLQELNNEIVEQENKKEGYQAKLSEKLEKQNTLQKEQNSLEEKEYKIEKEFQEIYEEIESYSEELKFTEVVLMLKDLQKDKNTKIDFTYLKNRIFQYQNRIKQIKEKLFLQKQLEEKRNDHQLHHDQLEKEYQELNDKINNQEEEILKELREIKDQILLLSKNNQILKITQEEYNDIISCFNNYQIGTFSTAKNKYDKLAENLKKSITDEFYRIKEKKNRKEEDIKKIEKVLEDLKNQKEEEIPLDEEEQETLQFLEESNIPYINFYKAVEFKENLDPTLKNKIESILLSSKILSSIIVSDTNKKQIKGHKGTYLFASSKKTNNLTDYLTVSPSITNTNISSLEVTKVLESISIDSNDLHFITTDYYQMDFLTGYSSNKTEAKYIGAFLREQEHKRKIKEQETLLENEKSIYRNLESLLEGKSGELSLLNQEKEKFPEEEKLLSLSNEKNKLSLQLELINNEQLKVEKVIRDLSKELDDLFRTLNELKKDISLPLYLETFEEALQNVDYLKNSVLELEKVLVRYQNNLELQETKKEQLIELELTLEETNEDLRKTQLEIKKKKIEKQDLEEILNTDAYRDLSKSLLEMKARQDEIDKLLGELNQKHGRSENLIEIKKQDKIALNEKIKHQDLILTLSEKFFVKEYQLHYVMEEEITNPKTIAKKVLEKLHTRKDSDIDNVKNNYYAAYNEYRLKLNDYHLANINLFNENEFDVEEIEDAEIKRLIQENRRIDMTAMYQGRKLNLYMLTTALQDAIVENNQIISDQDRHLFEEILLKTIGTKIRDRIADSKEWVKKMNDIMKKMQEDSALSFQLEWRSKEAESMDEIETKELVRIFQIPADALKPSDSEKLIKHFRSKLKRHLEQNAENYATYANVIFEVLDYRTWFEFKMNYQRTGENKKELTDKVFSVFSGGEKAKTMYIPLFAAVYAKLMSARSDALRVVALDEAFAGVDDGNIREMFGIMSSLDLDYILTSQALWGDYDTISDLAISELLRPNNSSVVGIRRYHWNGKTKEVVFKKEIEDAIRIF